MGRHKKNASFQSDDVSESEPSNSDIFHSMAKQSVVVVSGMPATSGTPATSGIPEIVIDPREEVAAEETDFATDLDNTRKKRGRKPKEKFNYESDPLKFGKYTEHEESIIVKLPISCLEVETNAFSYNPDIVEPTPFDNFDNSQFTSHVEIVANAVDAVVVVDSSEVINAKYDYKTLLENESNAMLEGKHTSISTNIKNLVDGDEFKPPIRQIDIILQNKSQKEQRLELLVQFSNNLFTFNEGIRTDIACFWCCHGFECHPWGIPTKLEHEKFHLFGVFCSANCAAAYLFNVHNKDNLWDMYSLLNLLNYKVYGNHRQIIHAPDKICLKKFGGNLDINEYRNRTAQEDKSYIIKFPPCTSVIPVMEEVNMRKIQSINNKTYIPIDKTRINQANTDLRLKRNKPIHDTQNTLDKCMNISSS